jgi:hypothetical protein
MSSSRVLVSCDAATDRPLKFGVKDETERGRVVHHYMATNAVRSSYVLQAKDI